VSVIHPSIYPEMYSWEQLWAPHDEPTYRSVLAALSPADTLLEIGAGDLRLAVRMAAIVSKVYAIEIQETILERAAAAYRSLPENLVVLAGDARTINFPPGITTGVLLMRHCTHFNLYIKKLQAAGCQRLVTNARWRSGLELIDLASPRVPYDQLELGWYACLCGRAGFKTGAVELLSDEVASMIVEVDDCPGCRYSVPEWLPSQAHDLEIGYLPDHLDRSGRSITLFQEGARAK
jgi:hypothetical protein